MSPLPAEVDPAPIAPVEVRRAQAERLKKAWETPSGWRYWSAVNNSEVGVWYTAAALVFLLVGGLLALVMRVQLAVPGNTLLTGEAYDRFFTMHGSIMMFLFAVPVFEAFSIFVLPDMLGARDLPFPRLSAFGFWSFVFGGTFFCLALPLGIAPSGGWFMYPPLTSGFSPGYGADVWLLALSFIEVSSIAAAVEIIVGVLISRAPGMRINLIPLYAWYILVVAVMILFAFPPLIAGDLLLELERTLDWPFFDVNRGGDPILWQHLFWIFGHPEVYIVFPPSVALVATMVPTFAKRPMIGYAWIVLAAVGTGFLSFGLWVHHMFTTGLPGLSLSLFSAASVAVAVPTSVQIFCFLATLLAGKVDLKVPLLFSLGGLSTFVLGGLGGVMVALLPVDLQAHDTYFVVGHLHLVLIGGTVFPVVGGVYYYFPLVGGRRLSERLGKLAFVLMYVGFMATFPVMHLTGLLGMPRRVHTWTADPTLDALNLVSSIGAFVLGLGVLVVLVDVLRPGKEASPRDPWGAGTLEWLASMPNESWGVRTIPEVDSRFPLWDQPGFVEHVDQGRFFLPDAEEGLREMIVTSPVDAAPIAVLRVPGNTFVTFWAALFVGGVFLFSTFHWWVPASVSGVLALGTILFWLWTGTSLIPEKETKAIGYGRTLPLYDSGRSSPGWWATVITMLADLTAFFSLVFGYFFYWTVHEAFPPPELPDPGLGWPLAAAGAAAVAWGAAQLSRRWNRQDRAAAFYGATAVGTVASLASGAALLAGPWANGMDPTVHVYPATVWVLVGYAAAHAALGALLAAWCAARRAFGRMTGRYDKDAVNAALYWQFTALIVGVTVAVVAGFPLVSG